MQIAVSHAQDIAPDPALLSALEREALSTIHGARRRDEWIRGRLALRRALGDAETSVVIAPDGAPLPIGGAPCSVSLSHDGDWIAVAIADSPIGIDLCVRAHAARISRILAWLDVRGAHEPLAAWTALEAALKLRRLGIEALRDRPLELRAPETPGTGIVVHGLGAPITVWVHDAPEYVVGLAVA